MGKTRAALVSFNTELTEQNRSLQLEMKSRYDNLESRLASIESRLDDLAKSVEIRHADMWKLIIDINTSLPMTVAMSVSDVMSRLTDEIKSNIADTRVELSGLIASNKLGHD